MRRSQPLESRVWKLSPNRSRRRCWFIPANAVIYVSFDQFFCQPLVLHHCQLQNKFSINGLISKTWNGRLFPFFFFPSFWLLPEMTCMNRGNDSILRPEVKPCFTVCFSYLVYLVPILFFMFLIKKNSFRKL